MALSDTRDYVLAVEHHPHEAAEIARRAAQKLESHQTTLIELVQSLGEYINEDDDKIRARAVAYLVAVIAALPPKHLSRQQIQVLCQFLCDRIQDGGAVDGLSLLQRLERFTPDMVHTVVRAVFATFGDDLQSRNQAGRYRIYQLLNDVLDHHRKAVRALGDEFLVAMVELVAGEKDPRNLMLIFSMLRVLMVEWDIATHVEVLFDAVYAYFPITFRPPPNDPYGITAQDLKLRLRGCMAATGLLAPHTFPSLLDRLDSTSPAVKTDVLQTLAACAATYGPAVIGQYAITLWDAVKFEILQAQEPELAQYALEVLKAVAAALSHGAAAPGTPNSQLGHYLKPVDKECLEHLQEPASRQAKASGDILRAVASASLPACEIVVQAVGPALFTLFQSSAGVIQQRAVLEVANQLFEASLDVYGSWAAPSRLNPAGRPNLVGDFKDRFVAIYSQALMGTVKEEVSFRLTAATGLLLVSQMNSVLADAEIGLIVQHFDDIVLAEESYGRDELKRRAMTALAAISSFKPALIADITFPAFMARLPDSEHDAQAADYTAVLEGLAEISVEKDLLATLVRRLLNKLDILVAAAHPGPHPYACALLGTVLYVLNRSAQRDAPTADFAAYFDRVVVGLCRRSTTAREGPLVDHRVLDLLGRIANLIVRHCPPDQMQRAADNVYLLFRDGPFDPAAVRLSMMLEPPTVTLLATWLLAAVPGTMRSTVLHPDQLPHTVDDLVDFASRSPTRIVAQSCLMQIALLVNKHVDRAGLSFVDRLLAQRRTALRDVPMDGTDSPGFDVRLVYALTKALVLRLAPQTDVYLTGLVELLDKRQYPSDVGRMAAMGFATLLAPDDVLAKTNGAQVRLLAPQRVFQTVTPLIADRFKAAPSPVEKENYLITLSGVLSSVPSDIVMPELPTILPLLLQSLDIADQMVNVATLETLAVVITNNPAALVESGHLPALVKRLLAVASASRPRAATAASQPAKAEARPATSNHPKTRRLATRCLTLMPKYVTGGGAARANPLLGLKREVLHGLTGILDDTKRDVRKEAVDARAAWLRGVDDHDDEDDE